MGGEEGAVLSKEAHVTPRSFTGMNMEAQNMPNGKTKASCWKSVYIEPVRPHLSPPHWPWRKLQTYFLERLDMRDSRSGTAGGVKGEVSQN